MTSQPSTSMISQYQTGGSLPLRWVWGLLWAIAPKMIAKIPVMNPKTNIPPDPEQERRWQNRPAPFAVGTFVWAILR